MPWSKSVRNPRILYGDEGEWIATCSTPEVAEKILQLSTSSTDFFTKGGSRGFDAHVDAIVNVVDNHFAKQELIAMNCESPIVSETSNPNSIIGGWTNHL
jgi:hypothetical protein